MIQVNLQTMGEQKRTDTSIAQELAKAKNVIDKFLYGCSHTMRGPLKSISGLIKLLQNPEATEDPYKHLELIQKTVNKMETILNDLEQFLVNSRRDLVIESVSMSKHPFFEKYNANSSVVHGCGASQSYPDTAHLECAGV
jgi:light-regulated signal transduction histidine kinase (bacteriophytochrome)